LYQNEGKLKDTDFNKNEYKDALSAFISRLDTMVNEEKYSFRAFRCLVDLVQFRGTYLNHKKDQLRDLTKQVFAKLDNDSSYLQFVVTKLRDEMDSTKNTQPIISFEPSCQIIRSAYEKEKDKIEEGKIHPKLFIEFA
jgi:hypothetical protein